MVLLVSGLQSFLACHWEVCRVLFCPSFIPVECLSGMVECIPVECLYQLVESRLYAYADDSTLLAVVRKLADRPAVAASLNRDFAMIKEWCNHWCIILNLNKTKRLVVSRHRTVNPPDGDLVLSGVSICDSSNLDILSLKFDSRLTFEDHVRGIVFRVSQRIVILRLVKRVFVDTFVLLRCYYAFVLPIHEYCSPVWGSAAKCHLQLNTRCIQLDARCIRLPSFFQIRLSCHCVIYVILLHCVCYTKIIRSGIIVCSVSSHLLLSELNIPYLRLQLIH